MGRRPELKLVAIPDPQSCVWCGGPVDYEQSMHAVVAQTLFDLKPKGECVEIELFGGEKIIGGVARPGSTAAKEGWDMFFEVCSHDCADRLAVALAQDAESFFVVARELLEIDWDEFESED